MHMRFLSGWRLTLLCAVMAGLVFAPFAAVVAETPQSQIDRGQQAGFGKAKLSDGDGPTKRVATYARSNYVWPYEVGPSYGTISADQRLFCQVSWA